MKFSWSNRVGGSIVAVAAVALAGCGEPEPERIGIAFNMGEPQGAFSKESVVAPAPVQAPDVSSFGLDRAVHWIEVMRCDAESADCEERVEVNGNCGYASAFMAWETAMGVNYCDRFDDVLRGEPKITGPIVYGERPENAGWQTKAEPLLEGERYAINVYVYEACDDLDIACVHTKAVGCEFFTISNGVPVALPATATEFEEE